jgi:hypothetical protein
MKPGTPVRILRDRSIGVVVSAPRKRWMVGYTVDVLVGGVIKSIVIENVEIIDEPTR